MKTFLISPYAYSRVFSYSNKNVLISTTYLGSKVINLILSEMFLIYLVTAFFPSLNSITFSCRLKHLLEHSFTKLSRVP